MKYFTPILLGLRNVRFNVFEVYFRSYQFIILTWFYIEKSILNFIISRPSLWATWLVYKLVSQLGLHNRDALHIFEVFVQFWLLQGIWLHLDGTSFCHIDNICTEWFLWCATQNEKPTYQLRNTWPLREGGVRALPLRILFCSQSKIKHILL